MKWINVEQNTDEWLNLRLGKITASKFGAIMSEGGFGKTAQDYALQLALERIKGTTSTNQAKTYHMKRGHEQEPIAKALYEAYSFCDVKNGGFFDGEYYGDSPDGIIGVDGLVEIKSVIASVHRSTVNSKSYDKTYHWQIVGHLECSNREWCDFISYCADYPEGKQLYVYRVHREDVIDDITHLRERRIEFNKLVEQIVSEINEMN